MKLNARPETPLSVLEAIAAFWGDDNGEPICPAPIYPGAYLTENDEPIRDVVRRVVAIEKAKKPERLSDLVDGTPQEINATIAKLNRIDAEGPTNEDRAEWARQTLAAFAQTHRADTQSLMRDLLCALMHYCDRWTHLQFAVELAAAQMHYSAETEADPHEAPTCNAVWFTDGGRTERRCNATAPADQVCAECGAARCDDHDSLGFEEVNGRILCTECQPQTTEAQ